MSLLFELLELVAILALVVPGLHVALGAYVARRRPDWSRPLQARRLVILFLLVCGITALRIGDEVIDGDTHPVDEALLLFLREHLPAGMVPFFEAVTLTGSWKVLTPLTVMTAAVLLVARKRFEAALLAGSMIGGSLLIYAIKTLVERPRPALWDTETYWGSSFPSGHTLAVAVFATTAVICISRDFPRLRVAASLVAIAWVALVGLSRMVLGVHWPTDTLVAACLGAFIPLSVSLASELRARGS